MNLKRLLTMTMKSNLCFNIKIKRNRSIFNIWRNKKIPRSEKRRSARKMINNAIVGKSVRFTTDEGSYEAKIGKDFANKNIYGDNQTKNKTAIDKKINLFFENDTLQLLDGVKFDENKLDRNNKHGHKILGWDYFKKEVIIGNVGL